MNLFWVVAIALFVLAEKLFPKGELVALAGGLAMAVVGAALIFRFWQLAESGLIPDESFRIGVAREVLA